MQLAGDGLTDGRLPRAHEADQDEIVQWTHGVHVFLT